jgi:hypothetical protein
MLTSPLNFGGRKGGTAATNVPLLPLREKVSAKLTDEGSR